MLRGESKLAVCCIPGQEIINRSIIVPKGMLKGVMPISVNDLIAAGTPLVLEAKK